MFVKEDVAPASLLDVMLRPSLPAMHGPCDRCMADVQPVARLWVPAGASIVQVECCSLCKTTLDADFVEPQIEWR